MRSKIGRQEAALYLQEDCLSYVHPIENDRLTTQLFQLPMVHSDRSKKPDTPTKESPPKNGLDAGCCIDQSSFNGSLS